MIILNRLRQRCEAGERPIQVATVGCGLIGRGLVRQLHVIPGMTPALIVNRTTSKAVETYQKLGFTAADIVVSGDPAALDAAIESGRPTVTTHAAVLRHMRAIDVVVEVTGAVQYGAEVALHAIEGGKHIVMMNAETDATIGPLLCQKARTRGVVYTNSDGDQPGVLNRLVGFVEGMGLDVVAAVNCKGFMDIHATPETIRPWAQKQNTSLPMTTAFTDGTKMNIENAVLANATGLLPGKRGMHGVKTELKTALEDCLAVFEGRGLVDYTLGGDFKGGVFVIGHGEDAEFLQPYLTYLKMGDGPNYLFFRPYHLCHFETPFSIAEAVLDRAPTIAPLGAPQTEVMATAKRELRAGDPLDGIGGFNCYGEIEVADRARGMLPIGLTEYAELVRPVAMDQPVPLDAVELDEDSLLVRLYREQQRMFGAADQIPASPRRSDAPRAHAV